jgi:DNA-binding transcriptional regulator YhcF (GntR family)
LRSSAISSPTPTASPLYMQLANKLSAGITSGDWRANEALPSERMLSDMLDISRVTARKAIDMLCERGMLTRRRGSGTYITPKLEQPLSRLTSFSEELSQRGFTAGSRWLEHPARLHRPARARRRRPRHHGRRRRRRTWRAPAREARHHQPARHHHDRAAEDLERALDAIGALPAGARAGAKRACSACTSKARTSTPASWARSRLRAAASLDEVRAGCLAPMRLITLAPEIPGTWMLVRRCARRHPRADRPHQRHLRRRRGRR